MRNNFKKKETYKTMKKILLVAAASLLAVGCGSKTAPQSEAVQNPLEFVDPLIGSGYHGHVFVGASVPFGAVQLGVTNIKEGWDWVSGYHISDSTNIGYAHTHLSGTGIGDKGDILFMPYTGELKGYDKTDYVSTFKRADEVTEAGYYEVVDQTYGVKAELTASTRVGFHRYTFPEGETPKLLINLKQGIGWDKADKCFATKTSPTRIEGYRLSKGWAEDDRVYFVAEFSKPITSFEYKEEPMVALLDFEGTGVLEAKVAISGVDIEGAAKNLEAETKGVSFDEQKVNAQKTWSELLGKIKVTSSDTSRLRTFYTSLYHTVIYPALFNDVDGRYRGADGKIYSSQEDIYTQFSLWDTYRAAHPFYTLYIPEKVPAMINSMLNIYDQQGKLPIWHLSGNETNCMTGVSSVQVVGDAVMKNFKGIDYNRALSAMADYANLDERGLKEIREKGYYPADVDVESVARAMEYAISDAAVARVAAKLGDEELAEKFEKRSKGYARYFDKSDLFMKGVMSDGSFRTPFDPAHSTHRADDFCEGNSWQYTWMVPHDYPGLFELMGGVEIAEKRLDLTYATPFVPGPDASPDISGMMGQVAHGNEPSHSTPFAYAAMGKPEKTAKVVRHILDSLYNDTPRGISGNEDMGEMSAWYVLNAMGIYQPDPSDGIFVFSSPVFERVEMALPGGKELVIVCDNYSPENYAIQSATFNGEALDGSITYEQLMSGGELRFVMADAAAAVATK